MKITMLPIMILSLFLGIACSQAPKKQYNWVSLSEQGLIGNTLTVLKETRDFQSDGGFQDLEQTKHSLPDKKKDSIKKIVLIGDTGCRLKESKEGEKYQNCKNPQEWVYPNLMDKIVAEKPDLIIHVGDYHYREHCSPGKVCRQYTESIGYGWKSWDADFFAPSQKGLLAAPWIFLRGNHEDCKRAFAGYKILSEQSWKEACIPNEKTEYIQIDNLLIVQLDSASVSDKAETAENQAFWDQQFKDIEKNILARKPQQVWLITHKPLIGLNEGEDGKLETLNINLQKAFAKTKLAKKIDFLIGGHIHNTQLLKAKDFPKQLVVGNSGSSLYENKEFQNLDKILKNKIGGLKITEFFSDTKSGHSFGFATMTKSADGKAWELSFKDLEGQTTKSFPAKK